MTDRTVVALKAIDWAMVEGPIASTHDWSVINAELCGYLVKETEEFITLTQQWFDDGGVRYTLTIPKITIVPGSMKKFIVKEST